MFCYNRCLSSLFLHKPMSTPHLGFLRLLAASRHVAPPLATSSKHIFFDTFDTTQPTDPISFGQKHQGSQDCISRSMVAIKRCVFRLYKCTMAGLAFMPLNASLCLACFDDGPLAWTLHFLIIWAVLVRTKVSRFG